MNYPKTIKDLIECFKKLPGVGEKTAEKYIDAKYVIIYVKMIYVKYVKINHVIKN